MAIIDLSSCSETITAVDHKKFTGINQTPKKKSAKIILKASNLISTLYILCNKRVLMDGGYR